MPGGVEYEAAVLAAYGRGQVGPRGEPTIQDSHGLRVLEDDCSLPIRTLFVLDGSGRHALGHPQHRIGEEEGIDTHIQKRSTAAGQIYQATAGNGIHVKAEVG